jgi:hypothetical protein
VILQKSKNRRNIRVGKGSELSINVCR